MVALQTDWADRILRERGEVFVSRQLSECAYMGPDGKRRTLKVHDEVLKDSERIYTNNTLLWQELARRGGRMATYSDAQVLLRRYQEDGLVLGVSGYTRPGKYGVEAMALRAFYDHLVASGNRPTLTVDGGVSSGVLGLNGVIAQSLGIPSLGAIPLQGLDSVGYRNHSLIYGNTYRDREVVVGLAPHLLLCVGGVGFLPDGRTGGTLRECRAHIENLGVAVLVGFRKYDQMSLTETFCRDKVLNKALKSGQLYLCETLADVPEVLKRALGEVAKIRKSAPAYRQQAIERLLI